MTAPLYAIGRFCSRHHWVTIGLWWLPSRLGRLVPHISIEGENFFARRDAALAKAEESD